MIERPRGTRDFGPIEMSKRRYVENVFRRTSESFGFKEVMTPTFEYAELFTRRSGPSIVKQMYSFKDKSGRKIALRPELTAPVIRFYLGEMRKEPKPLKLYYVGNCFRYEEPQYGRYREFFHYGAELIGAPPLDSDAEVIALAILSLKNVGLRDIEVRVGNIRALRSLLKADLKDQTKCLHFLEKKNFDGLRKELKRLGIQEREKILSKMISLRGGVSILKKAEDLLEKENKEGIQYLRKLGDQLRNYGIKDYEFDLGVVRGLDYYTGMVFEIDSPHLGAEKQMCGGGSYSLAEALGEEPITSTGFAIGFDRVMLALAKEGRETPLKRLQAFVVPIGGEMREKAFQILMKLRKEGISADIDLMHKGPSKNLDYANAIGAERVVLVGESEWKRGCVSVREMDSGRQFEIPLKELVKEFS